MCRLSTTLRSVGLSPTIWRFPNNVEEKGGQRKVHYFQHTTEGNTFILYFNNSFRSTFQRRFLISSYQPIYLEFHEPIEFEVNFSFTLQLDENSETGIQPGFSKYNCLTRPYQNFAMAKSDHWVYEGVDVNEY